MVLGVGPLTSLSSRLYLSFYYFFYQYLLLLILQLGVLVWWLYGNRERKGRVGGGCQVGPH